MSETRSPSTSWAFQVGNLLGIPIRVHWTFVLLVVWVGAITVNQGDSFLVGVILTLFTDTIGFATLLGLGALFLV